MPLNVSQVVVLIGVGAMTTLAAASTTQSRLPVDVARSPQTLADFSKVRGVIKAEMEKDSIPGVAVAVARDGVIVWEEGFGWANTERQIAADAHTPFYTASITKTFTSTALMVLQERGLIDLDAAANTYLPRSPLTSTAWNPSLTTVRDVANQRSGLGTFALTCFADDARCRTPGMSEVIARYGIIMSPPHERFEYSNLNYGVLGHIVEQVSRDRLGTFLQSAVFGPLEMKRSSLGVEPTLEERTAVRYAWERGPRPRADSATPGASGGYASAHDLALFGAFHAGSEHATPTAVLRPASLRILHEAAVATGGSQAYSFGWWVTDAQYGYTTLVAQGGTDDAAAWLKVIPSAGIAVAAVANKGVALPEQVVEEVLSLMLPDYGAARSAHLTAPAAPATSASASAGPVAPGKSLQGRWEGWLNGPDLRPRLVLTVEESGRVAVDLAEHKAAVLTGCRFLADGFRGRLPQDLHGLDDLGPAPSELDFNLRLVGDKLQGTATSRPASGAQRQARMTYWVELRASPTQRQ